MILTTREDVEAPIAYVFDALSDFESFERAVLRRGAEVVRTDRMTRLGPGMTWRAIFTMRGKPRRLTVALQGYERPTLMRFDGESKNMEGDLAVELLSLSPRRTRISLRFEVRPTSLTARIMLQSLRLARARIVKRFKDRAGAYAIEIEDRYKSGTA